MGEDEEAKKASLEKITAENLKKYVGQPPYSSDRLFPDGTPAGVVMGLAWTALGGKTLMIEVRGSTPSKKEAAKDDEKSEDKKPAPAPGPRLKVTGELGSVMGESTDIALTYSRM